MAQQSLDYGELFCAAVDTIVQERLSHVSYDRTILCTIIDDSQREQGIYTVSENNSTKFIAYTSDTSYRNGNNVYVSIPGGDWNQQKLIVSKKTDKTNEPYVYQKPFSSLVDVTGNLISNSSELKGSGLIANASTPGKDTYEDEKQSITLWSYNSAESKPLIGDTGLGFSGYTRLGIQAGFQSWLNPFYLTIFNEEGNIDNEASSVARRVIDGVYGLRLRIHAEREKTSKDEFESASDKNAIESEDKKEQFMAIYDLYLTQADMNGNPYDFESFFIQEKVFDISSLGKIIQMELQFYQEAQSFKDSDGNEIPYTDFLGNLIKPNLYVNDVYITLGYDAGQFEDEMVQIYTLNPMTYSRTADPISKNYKEIQLRWIQKQSDGSFKSITEKDNVDFELRWYRYRLGSSSADEYSNVYWSYLSKQITKNKISEYSIEDEDWLTHNKANSDDFKKPSFFSTWLIPDTTLQDEQIKAILFYDGKIYRSNVLYFTNEDEVVSKPTVDAVQALSVNCEDDSFGNYRIYNLGNNLIDFAQGKKIRTWKPYFKSSANKENTAPIELTEAEEIEWIIPTKNTMIVLDEDFLSGQGDNIDEDGRIHIVRLGDGVKGTNIADKNHQNYRIRSYYSQNYSNNTIQCKVTKDKITYTAIKELTFGPAGTTGTDVTLILDIDNPITINGPQVATITARLYDYENNEINLVDNENIKFAWSWKAENGKLKIENETINTPNACQISLINGQTIDVNYHILQATLSGWGDYDLTAYLPIPIRSSTDYNYMSGTTQILYDSSGELLDYFKNPYRLYKNDGSVYENIRWVNEIQENVYYYPIYNGISDEEVYTPKIYVNKNNEYSLQPLNIYVKNACEQLCVMAWNGEDIVWSQPILVLQNRYPAAMINEWNGQLKIDDKNNAILSAKIVAGRKDDNNQFTGVMMGDWQETNTETGLIENTGLYGFNKGEQTFGFKDDGTAFIGTSGAGRIHFDGEESIIESSAYQQGISGMSLNLKDGTIKAHNFTLSAGDIGSNNSIQITTEQGTLDNPILPLKIGSKFNVDWNGKLTATDGVFTGEINATSGSITGNLDVSGTLSGGSSYDWSIDSTGVATFSYINANGGTIGGWKINTGSLSYNNTLYLDGNSGQIYSSNNNFSLNSSGYMAAYSGTIGGCSFTSGGISAAGTGYSWSIGSNGYASFAGADFDGKITATGGKITGALSVTGSLFGNGWTLNNNGLSFTGNAVLDFGQYGKIQFGGSTNYIQAYNSSNTSLIVSASKKLFLNSAEIELNVSDGNLKLFGKPLTVLSSVDQVLNANYNYILSQGMAGVIQNSNSDSGIFNLFTYDTNGKFYVFRSGQIRTWSVSFFPTDTPLTGGGAKALNYNRVVALLNLIGE